MAQALEMSQRDGGMTPAQIAAALECELYPEYPTSITEWTGNEKPNSKEEEYAIAGAIENVAFLENNCKEGKRYTGHLNYRAKENNDNTIYRSSYMNLRSSYK